MGDVPAVLIVVEDHRSVPRAHDMPGAEVERIVSDGILQAVEVHREHIDRKPSLLSTRGRSFGSVQRPWIELPLPWW